MMVGLLNVIVTVVAVFIIDRCATPNGRLGRKPLMVGGLLVMSFGAIVLGVAGQW